MLKYITGRVVAMLLTLFVIMTVAFMVVRLMPGSVYDDPDLPTAVADALEARMYLGKPLPVQYFYFIKGILLDSDWGTSVKIEPGVPAFQVLRGRIPVSLLLNCLSLAVALPVGALAGTASALKRNRLADRAIAVLTVIFVSVPSFVFASMLQYTLGFKWGFFPIIYQPYGAQGALPSLFLPVLALALGPIATVSRYLRGELIESLSSDYMLLARAKGLSRAQATVRHAFRNSLVPLATIVIPMFTGVLGGSLVIEGLFAIPGVGGIMINAINANDHPLTMAALMFYSTVALVTTLIVDISYGIIDPRIRMGGKE